MSRPQKSQRLARQVGPEPSRVANRVATVVIAAVGIALTVAALRLHAVGDPEVEKSFYTEHAVRPVSAGERPASLLAAAPYDAVLAVGRGMTDPFTAAKLVSVGSAIAALICWFAVWKWAAGPREAAWAIVLFAMTPAFVRYGCAATKDMFLAALVAGAIALGLVGRGSPAGFGSGALSALAFLTDPSALGLVLGAGLSRSIARGRIGITAWRLGGFAFVLVPASLLALHGGSFADQPGGRSWELLAAIPLGIVALAARAQMDLQGLGWPFATMALAGASIAIVQNRGARVGLLALLAAGLVWAGAAVASESAAGLHELAIPCGFAGIALAAIPTARGRGIRAYSAAAAVTLLIVIPTIALDVSRQVESLRRTPREVPRTAQALGHISPRPRLVMSRLPQIGYHAGLAWIEIPEAEGLADLAEHAALNGVDYLHHDAGDGPAHARFAYLLDPDSPVPGLVPIQRTSDPPSATFRIEPGFGASPTWFDPEFQGDIRSAHVLTRILSDSAAADARLLIAVHALGRDDLATALERASEVLALRPDRVQAWVIRGAALTGLGRAAEAIEAYRAAVQIDPSNRAARLALGEVSAAEGDVAAAARQWRTILIGIRDPALLRLMADTFRRSGDETAARAAEMLTRRVETRSPSVLTQPFLRTRPTEKAPIFH